MRRAHRRVWLACVLTLVFFVASVPLIIPAELRLRREGLRLAEAVGIMDTGRGLGGQILRYNFYRHPVWAHWGVQTLSASGALLLPVGVSLLLFRRVSGVRHATRCGVCHTNVDLRGGFRRVGDTLRCPRCDEVVSS